MIFLIIFLIFAATRTLNFNFYVIYSHIFSYAFISRSNRASEIRSRPDFFLQGKIAVFTESLLLRVPI